MSEESTPKPWWANQYISDPFKTPEMAAARAAGDARPPACMVWTAEANYYVTKLQPAREKITKLRQRLEAAEAQLEADTAAFENFNRLYNSCPEAQAYDRASQAASLASQKLRIP